MNTFSRSRLSLVLAALTSTVIGCVGAAPNDSSEGPEPTESGFLYGLSREEILTVHELVADQYDVDTWLELNKAPFDCARYGDMCDSMGRDAAYTITEESYRMALDGATLPEIDAYLATAFDAAEEAWATEAGPEDERGSKSVYDYGGSTQERVKLTLYINKPLVSSLWNVKAACTYQVLNLGTWGWLMNATMTAGVQGKIGGVLYPAGGYKVHSDTAHTVPVLQEIPKLPGTIKAYGMCKAKKLNWSGYVETTMSE